MTDEPYDYDVALQEFQALKAAAHRRADRHYPKEVQHAEVFGKHLARSAFTASESAEDEVRAAIDEWDDVPDRPAFDNPAFAPW